MSNTVVDLSNMRLTRVLYTDALVPPEIMGLTVDDIEQVNWRTAAEYEDAQPRVGVAAWVIETAGLRVVVDPVQAADAVLRADSDSEAFHQDAFAAVLADAGFARETIDAVIMTHIEGIGMVAKHEADGSWSSYFPNATLWIGRENCADYNNEPEVVGIPTHQAWEVLLESDRTVEYNDGQQIVPGVRARTTNGHCPGHSVLDLGDGTTPEATMIGHLAISPLHLSTGLCPQQHPSDPQGAWDALCASAADERYVIGPLWPSPGIGQFIDEVYVPFVVSE